MQRKRQDDASNNAQKLSVNGPGAGFKTCGLHLMQGLTGKGGWASCSADVGLALLTVLYELLKGLC